MAAPTPFHERNQESYVDTRKWYLQEEFLKPPHQEINKDEPPRDFGVTTTDILSAAHEGNATNLRNLIARGGSVNASGAFGKTPLHYAVESGKAGTVEMLVENEANVNAQDLNGEAPLHIAARAGRLDIVQMLLHNQARRDMRNAYEKTAREIAKERGHTDCVKELYAVDIYSGEDAELNSVEMDSKLVKVQIKELRLLRMGIFRSRTIAKAESMRRNVTSEFLVRTRKEYEQFKTEKYDPLKRQFDNLTEEFDISKDLFENQKVAVKLMEERVSAMTDERHKAYLVRDQTLAKLQEMIRQRADDERGLNFTRNRMKNDVADLEKQKKEAREKLRAEQEVRERLETELQRERDQSQHLKHDVAELKDTVASLKREGREYQDDLQKARRKANEEAKHASDYKLQVKKYENIVIELKQQQKALKAELAQAKVAQAVSISSHPGMPPNLNAYGMMPHAAMTGVWPTPFATPQPPRDGDDKYNRSRQKHSSHHRRHKSRSRR